jgi:hypothetical protein
MRSVKPGGGDGQAVTLNSIQGTQILHICHDAVKHGYVTGNVITSGP